MSSTNSLPRVYTLPDCPKCDELKSWLKDRNIGFDERAFDTEVQTEFIMRNIFGNPPIFELGRKAVSSDSLFPKDELDEAIVMEVLNAEA